MSCTKSSAQISNRSFGGGVFSAIILSIAGAVLLIKLGAEFEGTAEEIYEGIAMLLAAGILTWMIFWMRSHADTLKTDLEVNVHQATLRSGMGAIFYISVSFSSP